MIFILLRYTSRRHRQACPDLPATCSRAYRPAVIRLLPSARKTAFSAINFLLTASLHFLDRLSLSFLFLLTSLFLASQLLFLVHRKAPLPPPQIIRGSRYKKTVAITQRFFERFKDVT